MIGEECEAGLCLMSLGSRDLGLGTTWFDGTNHEGRDGDCALLAKADRPMSEPSYHIITYQPYLLQAIMLLDYAPF